MSPFRKCARAVGIAIARALGTTIIDRRTGRKIGRALIIPWRGRIHVIGLDGAVRVEWLPQQRLTYWKQEIVFLTHPLPDFPNVRDQ